MGIVYNTLNVDERYSSILDPTCTITRCWCPA